MRPPEAELTQLGDIQRKKGEKYRSLIDAGQNKRKYANVGNEDVTEVRSLAFKIGSCTAYANKFSVVNCARR